MDKVLLESVAGISGTQPDTLTNMNIRAFHPNDESAVVELWHRCGLVRPSNDPHKDIARKLLVRPDLFLVGLVDNAIVATAMAGYEGHRGWINYLAVAPEHRRTGLARQIMGEAERLLREAGCPKINLQVPIDELGSDRVLSANRICRG